MKTYRVSIKPVLVFCLLLAGQLMAGSNEQLLKTMYEEEKLSYDLYTEFFNRWGLNVFDQVRESEAIHMQRIKELMDTKDIPQGTGIAGGDKGVYESKEVQSLYDQYTVLGYISDITALETAALMEESDIANLRSRIKSQSDERTVKIFSQMERASRNHLRAFVKSLKLSGIDYRPAVLTQAEYDLIINNVTEKGTALK